MLAAAHLALAGEPRGSNDWAVDELVKNDSAKLLRASNGSARTGRGPELVLAVWCGRKAQQCATGRAQALLPDWPELKPPG